LDTILSQPYNKHGQSGRRIERITDLDMQQLLDVVSHLRMYDLEQPRYAGAPALPVHTPGFVYTLHRRHEPGLGEARTGASGFIYTAEHSGTHIDALCHQAENLYLHGGRQVTAQVQTSTGFTELGVETIAPMMCRGVLLDVAGYRGVEWTEADQQITRQDLEAVCQHQGVEIQRGDVVLVRTGNGARWNVAAAYLAGGGVGADGSQWLADLGVMAVGADHTAWDTVGVVDSELGGVLSGASDPAGAAWNLYHGESAARRPGEGSGV
jgi:kynurenine formamidase